MKEGGFLFPSEGWSLISCAALIGKAEARTGSHFCMEMPDDRLHYEQTVAEQHTEVAFDWSSNMAFMKQSLV